MTVKILEAALKKPQVRDFSAPAETANEIKAKIEALGGTPARLGKSFESPVGWLVSTLVLFCFSYFNGDGRLAPSFLLAVFGGVFLWGLIIFLLNRIGKLTTTQNLTDRNALSEALEKREACETALDVWEEKNTLSGKRFWLSLKGEALEVQFQNLAALSGWDSWLTSKSGDGGIDVICEKKSHNRQLIIQCKGHSKAIGVGVIRDAVGVQSLYEGEMCVVAPIGFTKGSHALAKQTGIRLLSATALSNIAKGTDKL